MSITFDREAYNKVFNDLEKYRVFCRFEGKVFNEKALYNKEDSNWEAYQKWQGWLRAKTRNNARRNNRRRN